MVANPIASAAEAGDTTPHITGVVFYRLKSGASVILRGLNIYLLKAPGPMNDVDSKSYLGIQVQLATLKTTIALHEAVGDCPTVDELEKLVGKTAKYKVTTNIDAKYSFEGIPEGDYRVLAFLNTAGAKGVWDIPVNVHDKLIKLDLDNSNISMLCDISAR
jgi:hypothetical protein